ncbi:MAG: HAMP domain-containing histidine kinase [Oscillibacter sp.]|nr:HAMP domain-containing histidine kinase [Oscillibacter sp.]
MDFIRFALQYVYSRRYPALYIALCWGLWVLVFIFNGLPALFLSYLILFSLAPVLFFEIRRLLRVYQKRLTIGDITELNSRTLDELATNYPPEESFADEDYQNLLRRFVEASEEAEDEPEHAGLAEYYARWAREIKEPVNAMEQLLLTGDSPLVRRMSVELRHLEQYAEMAVVYARLETAPGYALRKYDLSAIVQKSLRKFGGEIIEKQISVAFEPVPVMVVTDGKWLAFMLEQILANSFKYTFSGGVTISIEREEGAPENTEDWEMVSDGNGTGAGPFLTVRDSGTGISEEILKHLLDANPVADGEQEARRGLGLYLCRRICGDLGHSISIWSKQGEGTCVRLELSMGLASPEEAPEAPKESPESEPAPDAGE